MQRAGLEGAVGVVGAFGFAAEDADIWLHAFGAKACAAEEAAATYGSENGVEAGDFFEQFFGSGGLAGDDAVVVVGMDEIGAGFGLHASGGFIAGSDGGFAQGDLRAVTLDGAILYLRDIFGHDHPGFYAAPCAGAGDGGSMIAAGLGDDAVGGFGVGQGEYRVAGAANFERAGFLKIVTLEKKSRAGEFVERRAGQYRRAMDSGGDARVSFNDGGPGRGREILRCLVWGG